MTIREKCLICTTWLALFIMCICICTMDTLGDITPQMTVFCICGGWVALFLIANRDRF